MEFFYGGFVCLAYKPALFKLHSVLTQCMTVHICFQFRVLIRVFSKRNKFVSCTKIGLINFLANILTAQNELSRITLVVTLVARK